MCVVIVLDVLHTYSKCVYWWLNFKALDTATSIQKTRMPDAQYGDHHYTFDMLYKHT